ncbi:MAG: NADAR family protein [Mycobacteriales bacterium]
MEQPSNVEELLAALDAGVRVKYLFFWGHRPEPDGSMGKGCLSQWWPVTFTEGDDSYASAEHYMMAGKARLFGDEEARARILACATPGEAKKLGRQVRGFDEAAWVAFRFHLVVAANVAKFGQHPELRKYLLDTGDRVLVEASPRDRIWGIGMGASNPAAEDPASWRGLNLLGFALTQAREQLRRP